MTMYSDFWLNNMGSMWGASNGTLGLILVPLALWTLVWKGMALWKAAQKEDKVWFVVLLVVNTLGILEILYIYLFSKNNSKKSKRK